MEQTRRGRAGKDFTATVRVSPEPAVVLNDTLSAAVEAAVRMGLLDDYFSGLQDIGESGGGLDVVSENGFRDGTVSIGLDGSGLVETDSKGWAGRQGWWEGLSSGTGVPKAIGVCDGGTLGASSEPWEGPVSGVGEWEDGPVHSDPYSRGGFPSRSPPQPTPPVEEVIGTTESDAAAPTMARKIEFSGNRVSGAPMAAATGLLKVGLGDIFDGHWPRRYRSAAAESGRSSVGGGSADVDWKEVRSRHSLEPGAGAAAWVNAAAELLALRRYREAVWCCTAASAAGVGGAVGEAQDAAAARLRAPLCAARALLALGRTEAAQVQLSRLLAAAPSRPKQSRRGAVQRGGAESASAGTDGGDGPVAAALREEEAAGDAEAAAAAARRAMATVARVECHVGRACALVDAAAQDPAQAGVAAAAAAKVADATGVGAEAEEEEEARGRHAVSLADRIQVTRAHEPASQLDGLRGLVIGGDGLGRMRLSAFRATGTARASRLVERPHVCVRAARDDCALEDRFRKEARARRVCSLLLVTNCPSHPYPVSRHLFPSGWDRRRRCSRPGLRLLSAASP
jgi:hypothetical protein